MGSQPKSKNQPEPSPVTELRAQIAALQSQVTELDPAAALLELKAQMTRIETGIAELQATVPALIARAPQPLSPEEVSEIVGRDPAAKLKALQPHRQSGLSAGEIFEPRTRFSTADRLVSLVRSGELRVARAA